jgi:hypothetical protein
MSDRESGHDLEDHPEGCPEAGHGAPGVGIALEHGRQQQCEQEQQMVEAAPDMDHSLARVIEKLRQARSCADSQLPHRALCRKNRGLRLPRCFEPQQSAVLRIGIE